MRNINNWKTYQLYVLTYLLYICTGLSRKKGSLLFLTYFDRYFMHNMRVVSDRRWHDSLSVYYTDKESCHRLSETPFILCTKHVSKYVKNRSEPFFLDNPVYICMYIVNCRWVNNRHRNRVKTAYFSATATAMWLLSSKPRLFLSTTALIKNVKIFKINEIQLNVRNPKQKNKYKMTFRNIIHVKTLNNTIQYENIYIFLI